MEEYKNIETMKIAVSDSNPRKAFDKNALKELAKSIQEKGLIEPIVVRPIKNNGFDYELVCGERRLRAFKDMNLFTIPAIIKKIDAKEAKELMLIENLQREDLTSIEEAEAFQELIKNDYPEKLIAENIGVSEGYVRNRLRLLTLPKEILKAIKKDEITASHGFVLLRLTDQEAQKELFSEILEEKLSIRATENRLDYYTQDLSRVQFDKTECHTCSYSGNQQKNLFDKDTNLNYQCLNKECFRNKVRDYINDKLDKLLSFGQQVIEEEELRKETGKEVYSFKRLAEYEIRELKSNHKIQCLGGCPKHYFCVARRQNNDVSEIIELCLDNSCYKRLTSPTPKDIAEHKEAEATMEEVDPRKAELYAEKLEEAKRRFYLKAFAESADGAILHALAIDRLIASMHYLTKEKFPSKTVDKIYCLGEKGMADLMHRALIAHSPSLTNREFFLLLTTVDRDVRKEFRIDEDYLKMKTKDQLIDLAKEIGLVVFLQKQKKLGMDKGFDEFARKKKSEMMDLFLTSGFEKTKYPVPKEIAKSKC